MKVLIIIPAYNEAQNLEKVIDNIIQNYPQYEYVVVNDGSTDETAQICEKNSYHVINLAVNLGIGGAVQTGYRYGEADIAIGSRFIERTGFQSSALRRMGIRWLSTMIFMTTGKKILDVTSGFRAVNARFITIYKNEYSSDYPEPEAIVAAAMHKARIAEVPVVMHERIGGISSINPGRSIYYMFKVTLAILICRLSFGFRR